MVDIKGFENYTVSEDGKVWSKKRNKYLKPRIHAGYERVALYTNRKAIDKSVHRLVLETFKPNLKNKPCCNHMDGNKLNNNIDNLEWVTYSENGIHAVKIGLHKPINSNKNGKLSGEGNGRSKLTWDIVKEIRLSGKGKRGEKTWEKYGISSVNFYSILRNKIWKQEAIICQ